MSDFKFSQDYLVYKSKKEWVYPVKERDWKRIKSIISSIIPNKQVFQVMSSASFGVFGSAIFGLIAIYCSDTSTIDNSIIITAWVIFFVSLIGGFGFLILQKLQKDIITLSVADVISEMDEIEKYFENPNGNEAEDGNSETTSA